MTIGYVEAVLSAENTWTDEIEIEDAFNVSVVLSALKIATVTLQRSYDKGVIWKDYKTYTLSYEDCVSELERKALLRIGIKTDDYSGQGTATVRISF